VLHFLLVRVNASSLETQFEALVEEYFKNVNSGFSCQCLDTFNPFRDGVMKGVPVSGQFIDG
jgi:hypothetical protein